MLSQTRSRPVRQLPSSRSRKVPADLSDSLCKNCQSEETDEPAEATGPRLASRPDEYRADHHQCEIKFVQLFFCIRHIASPALSHQNAGRRQMRIGQRFSVRTN